MKDTTTGYAPGRTPMTKEHCDFQVVFLAKKLQRTFGHGANSDRNYKKMATRWIAELDLTWCDRLHQKSL